MRLRKAKREPWKKFCRNLENTSDPLRLRKVLSKDYGVIDSFMESSNEMLKILMATNIPGCKINNLSHRTSRDLK